MLTRLSTTRSGSSRLSEDRRGVQGVQPLRQAGTGKVVAKVDLWQLRAAIAAARTDNPDQRIAALRHAVGLRQQSPSRPR